MRRAGHALARCCAPLSLALLLLAVGRPAQASDVDSEHLFGFTEGSDIGAPGERELEAELGNRSGRGPGSYRVISQATALKLSVSDRLRIAPTIAFDAFRISGVPGLPDRTSLAVSALALEVKYRALDRLEGPFGLTFSLTPYWERVDEISGAPIDSYGASLRAILDRELVADRLYAAANLSYGAARARSAPVGGSTHESWLAASAALSVRISERLFVGADVRYDRAYDGLIPSGFTGWGLYAGPSIYVRLSETAWVTTVWHGRIHGRSGSDTFSLAEVAQNLLLLRFGLGF